MVNFISTKYLDAEKSNISCFWNFPVEQNENLFYKFSSVPFNSIKNIKYPIDYSKSTPELNGEIDNFRQVKQDCWLLSGITALKNTNKGKKIIKSSIVNLQNSRQIVVNFKGVKQSITIPYEVFEAAKQSGNYVKGDDETLAIEIAAEYYKKQLIENNMANKKIGANIVNGKNVIGGKDNPLTGGYSSDIIYMLTGKVSKTIYNSNQELNKQIKNEIQKMTENPNKYVMTCNFKQRKNGLYINHAYTVKSVDNEYVTLINPHNTSKEEKIPIKDFYDNIKSLTFLNIETRF